VSHIWFRVALTLATVVFVGAIRATYGHGGDSATVTSIAPGGQSSSPTTAQVPSLATQTVVATPVGTDNGLCTARATMSLPAPPSPNYTQTVTGVLTCTNGIAPAGAIMHAVWHERAADKTCDATADATGTASCSRQIGALTSGYKVVIDVTLGSTAPPTRRPRASHLSDVWRPSVLANSTGKRAAGDEGPKRSPLTPERGLRRMARSVSP
jgi:hypothetical protein